jgi:hypothetical protein
MQKNPECCRKRRVPACVSSLHRPYTSSRYVFMIMSAKSIGRAGRPIVPVRVGSEARRRQQAPAASTSCCGCFHALHHCRVAAQKSTRFIYAIYIFVLQALHLLAANRDSRRRSTTTALRRMCAHRAGAWASGDSSSVVRATGTDDPHGSTFLPRNTASGRPVGELRRPQRPVFVSCVH